MHVCMYESESRIEKKSVLPCLNVPSPCSQHTDVPDFLITVFQSTSYEFVLVQHVSNPMVRIHFSVLLSL